MHQQEHQIGSAGAFAPRWPHHHLAPVCEPGSQASASISQCRLLWIRTCNHHLSLSVFCYLLLIWGSITVPLGSSRRKMLRLMAAVGNNPLFLQLQPLSIHIVKKANNPHCDADLPAFSMHVRTNTIISHGLFNVFLLLFIEHNVNEAINFCHMLNVGKE